jgi:hypothetical protein
MGLPTDAQVQRAAKLRAAVVAQIMGVSSRSATRTNSTAVQIPANNRLAVLRATVQQCTFCLDGQTSDRGATGPDKCYVSFCQPAITIVILPIQAIASTPFCQLAMYHPPQSAHPKCIPSMPCLTDTRQKCRYLYL